MHYGHGNCNATSTIYLFKQKLQSYKAQGDITKWYLHVHCLQRSLPEGTPWDYSRTGTDITPGSVSASNQTTACWAFA